MHPKKMDAHLRKKEGSCLVYKGSFHPQHCRKTEHETRLNKVPTSWDFWFAVLCGFYFFAIFSCVLFIVL